jgi:hypothetical protein
MRERYEDRFDRIWIDCLNGDKSVMPTAMMSTSGFDANKTRRYLVQRGFKPEWIVPYCYRPFDHRWLYWEPETVLLDRKR